MSLPKYQCHKIVEALKVEGVEFHEDGSATVAGPGRLVTQTKPGFKARCGAVEGGDLGYFVRYEDGYESWSPTEAFDSGYAMIEQTAVGP